MITKVLNYLDDSNFVIEGPACQVTAFIAEYAAGFAPEAKMTVTFGEDNLVEIVERGKVSPSLLSPHRR